MCESECTRIYALYIRVVQGRGCRLPSQEETRIAFWTPALLPLLSHLHREIPTSQDLLVQGSALRQGCGWVQGHGCIQVEVSWP